MGVNVAVLPSAESVTALPVVRDSTSLRAFSGVQVTSANWVVMRSTTAGPCASICCTKVVTLVSVCVVVTEPEAFCWVESVPVVLVLPEPERLPLAEPLTEEEVLGVGEELWVLCVGLEGCEVELERSELLELVLVEPDHVEGRPVGAPAPVAEEVEGVEIDEGDEGVCCSEDVDELEPELLLGGVVWVDPAPVDGLGCCD